MSYSGSFTSNDNQNPYTSSYSPNSPIKPATNSGSPSLESKLNEQKAIPLSAHLSNFGVAPEQKPRPMFLLMSALVKDVNKIKAQNEAKYQMKPDSLLYYFPLRQLQTIMATYPLDFPSESRQQMRSTLKQIRRRANIIGNVVFGIGGYWILCRRRPWFKLTDNTLSRFTLFLLCLNQFMNQRALDNHYTLHQVFANNRYFQEVITKHNLEPNPVFKMQLITES